MIYKVTISEYATKNIENAVQWYVENVNQKVALNFLKDYRRVYKSLQINPFYQFHDKNYRFLPFKKFPYIAFFMVDEEKKTVYINAVFHTSQNPDKYPK